MPSLPAALEAPLPPSAFRGRQPVVQAVCERLQNAERLSTSLVGGPKTGKTSLLRYLASEYASSALSALPYRTYVDAQLLSSTSSPSDFWVLVFRGLREVVPATSPLAALLDQYLQKAQNGTIDAFDIEDVFDEFGKSEKPAALLIDGWEVILKNQNYWGDFFHIVRSMGQRQPRGLAFVVGSPRRLLDLWDDKVGSPYFNIFANVTIGQMEETEVREYVRDALAARGVDANADAEAAVLAASDSHPYMVALVTYLVAGQLNGGGAIDSGEISQVLSDPNGKVVELIRLIRANLSASERLWLDNLRSAPQQVTGAQRNALERLRSYGLLPPGTVL